MNTVVIGAQWGDEGKGKIVDILAQESDVIVRFQGGNNAGHTLVVGNETYKLHLVPSGILYPNKICVLGNGMVIDPLSLLEEMEELEEKGHSVQRLFISEKAHVIMPYHKAMDGLEEKIKGGKKIGTTLRGIGPCYTDKVARIGVRIGDLLYADFLREKLCDILPIKEKFFEAFGERFEFRVDELVEMYCVYGERLRPHITDSTLLLDEAMSRKKKILFEGAQGTFLSVDHGSYPFVTSSNTEAANACCGSGIGPRKIDRVLGVAKAYTTRVGSGDFVTELEDEVGERLRSQGHEYGTTTGRPRRCGWLDLVMLKTAVSLNSIDQLAITKLDVLRGIDPLRICVAYELEGQILQHVPGHPSLLKKVKPIYEEMQGWEEDISEGPPHNLPPACWAYLKRIESFLSVPISIVSVGPERTQTLR